MVRVTCRRAECFATRGSAPIACPHQTVLCSDTPILGHRGNRTAHGRALRSTRSCLPGCSRSPQHMQPQTQEKFFGPLPARSSSRRSRTASASQACLKYLVETAMQKRSSCPGSRGLVSAETRLSPILSEPPHERGRGLAHSPSVGPLFAGQHRSERKRIRQGGKSPALDLLAVVRMLHDNCKVRAVCR